VLAFVARDAPSVLVLDDLQWSDSSTALLLMHVWHDAEPTRLLVIATFREPGETPCRQLRDGLDRLRGDPGFTRLTLAGLDADDTSALMQSPRGASVPRGVLRAGEPLLLSAPAFRSALLLRRLVFVLLRFGAPGFS
jgi:predicted ATPase